jgi:Domain of unknown function (DUF4412)
MFNRKSGINLLLTFLFLFSFMPANAQDMFEGKVTFKADNDGEEQLMTYLVKGTKFRIEPDDGEGESQGAMIYDSETQMMILLMNEQKMYMEMPMNESPDISSSNSDEPGYFEKTGASMDILGYPCDEFTFMDKDKKGFAWMTTELGPFLFMNNPKDMQSSKSQWEQEIMDAGYFPLLVKEEDSSGELTTIFEVTELVAMDLDEKEFVPPAGFTKFTMPNMPNMPDLMDMKKKN